MKITNSVYLLDSNGTQVYPCGSGETKELGVADSSTWQKGQAERHLRKFNLSGYKIVAK